MRRAGALWAVLAAAGLALAACVDRLPVDAADHHTALPKAADDAAPARTYPEPTYSVPHAAAEPASPASTPVPTAPRPADTCGASELAYLIGKPRTEIPIPADLSHRRVVCSACPVTQDVVPDRQTITYDSTSNLVTKVACG